MPHCRRSGKPTSLGCFDHEEEAARAYDKMMLWCELHHTSGMKGGITNFDPSEYEKDLAWLHTVSQVWTLLYVYLQDLMPEDLVVSKAALWCRNVKLSRTFSAICHLMSQPLVCDHWLMSSRTRPFELWMPAVLLCRKSWSKHCAAMAVGKLLNGCCAKSETARRLARLSESQKKMTS